MSKLDIILSDLKISIQHKYDYMHKFCKDYTAQFDEADITATASEEAVLKEKAMVQGAPIASCESLCIYRAIAEQLPQFDRFVFHGAAIEYEGEAYLFTAPSGTGKTTHINLWHKYLGDRVGIINGDKPIIKAADNITVYGTPWAGKEGYQRNTKAPLKAICIIKQGKRNSIKRLSSSLAINHLMKQVYMPRDAAALSATLALLGRMIEKTTVYELTCDISQEAFETSFNEMTR